MLKRFGNAHNPLESLGVAGFCRLACLAGTDPEKLKYVHELATAENNERRLSVLADRGEWDLVAECLAKVVKDKPDDFATRYKIATTYRAPAAPLRRSRYSRRL